MRIAVFVVIAVVILGGLFYLFKPKATVPPSTHQTQTSVSPTGEHVASSSSKGQKNFTFVIKNGKLVSNDKVINLTQGDRVLFTITSDEDNEFHVHGYEIEVELKKDVPKQLTFTANLTGSFPIELHKTDTQIALLQVQPK